MCDEKTKEEEGVGLPSLYYVWSCEKAMLHDYSMMHFEG
jgi:hypothetical protein